MKIWLKENWFKLGILVAVFIALILFFGNNGANQKLQNATTTNQDAQNATSTADAAVANSSTLQNIQPTEWFITSDTDVRDAPSYTGNILGTFPKGISFYATAQDPSENWLGFGWTDNGGNNQGAWISKDTLSSTTVNLTAGESAVARTLYTHGVVNLREYPWTTSRVLRTAPAGSYFQILQAYDSSSAGWIYVGSFDGVPYNAWLSKSVLYTARLQPQTQSVQAPQQQATISPALSLEAQSVVKLICKQNAYSTTYKQGSGVLYYTVTQGYGFQPYGIETNLHVVNTDDGSPSQCIIAVYPNVGDSSNYILYQSSGYNYINSSVDIAFVKPEIISGNANAGTLDDLAKYAQNELKSLVCDNVSLGNHLWILGYPAIGGETLTETDGIVSGFETDNGVPYIKTDAKIDHGNSGGIAVEDSGCFVGIPTFATNLGGFESLGRIINVPALFKLINTSNGVQPLHSN